MLWRSRTVQQLGRTAPPRFVHPCRPIMSKQPPSGEGWVHEIHDGYRLQIHAGNGRVRLYTIKGADWTDRYPLISPQSHCSRGRVRFAVARSDFGAESCEIRAMRTLSAHSRRAWGAGEVQGGV